MSPDGCPPWRPPLVLRSSRSQRLALSPHSTAALNAGVDGRVNAGSDTINALWDLGAVAFVTMGFASAALLWSTGLLALRAGALPNPLGILSLVGGAFIFVVSLFGTFQEDGAFSPLNGLMGEIGLFVLLGWVALVSVALVNPRSTSAGANQPEEPNSKRRANGAPLCVRI